MYLRQDDNLSQNDIGSLHIFTGKVWEVVTPKFYLVLNPLEMSYVRRERRHLQTPNIPTRKVS